LRSRSTPLLLGLAGLALIALAWFCASLLRGPAAPSGIAPPRANVVDVLPVPNNEESLHALTDAESEGGARGVPEQMDPTSQGASLSGRLTGLAEPQGYGEVRVALWPERTAPNCAQLAVAGPHSRVLRIVRAASDGTFRFEGLAPDVRFHLRAGGVGHASLALPKPLSPADGPVTLELTRVKGLRVELVGTDGKAPRVHPLLVEESFVLSGSEVQRHGALLEPWQQELVGIPGTGCDAEVSSYGRLLVLSGPAQFASVGPITCFAELPGYHSASPTFWAQLVVDRVQVEKLVLRQSTPGWGTLEVELAGLSDSLRAHISDDGLIGTLEVQYDDGTGFVLNLLGPATTRRLEGLPYGSARWSFTSQHGYRWPLEKTLVPLSIGNEVARARIDLSGSGGLRVAFDSPSRPHPLPFKHVHIAHESGGRLRQVAAEQLPHVLVLVEPGEWRQSIVSALVETTEVVYSRPLANGPRARVVPGEIATLTVSSQPVRIRPAAPR
jgi:hypothetical protein